MSHIAARGFLRVSSLRSCTSDNSYLGAGCPHIVCELRDVDNVAQIVSIGKGLVEPVCAHDIIGRLMIKCARSHGLAHVLETMMGFEGDEFYLQEWPELSGERFGEVITRFNDAVPVGIKKGTHVMLNPADCVIIEDGDEILVLAEDDDTYCVNCDCDGVRRRRLSSAVQAAIATEHAERLLFCGWRRDMADMIRDLDATVPSGSELWLLNAVPVRERGKLILDKGNKEPLLLRNLELKHAVGNHYSRRDLKGHTQSHLSGHEHGLQAHDAGGIRIPGDVKTLVDFDSILILAEQESRENNGPEDREASDSRSLTSLLIVQDMLREKRLSAASASAHNGDSPSTRRRCLPVSEFLDSRTSHLLSGVKDVGYVLSNEIVSAAIAQIAECRDMNQVLSSSILSARSRYLSRSSGNPPSSPPLVSVAFASSLRGTGSIACIKAACSCDTT